VISPPSLRSNAERSPVIDFKVSPKEQIIMETNDSAGAAVLVQTIFLKDGRLQGILGDRASKSPEAAMDFLKPFYLAALAMIANAAVAQES
jgi:hypothetical protein